MSNLGNKILLLATVILLLGCEKSPVEESNALTWEYGKNVYNLEIDGEERNFLIHVPEKYSGDIKVPLVMMLHGSTGTGTKFYNISRWVEKANSEGFIAIFPTALSYKIKDTNRNSTKWSSDGLPLQLEEGTVIKDDIPFIEGVIDLCKNTFEVDEKRLYISGFSNGGGFVKSEVITRLGHLFAAASAGGGVGHREEFEIEGARNTPYFEIVGNKDDGIIENLDPGEQVPIQGSDIRSSDFFWTQISNTLSGLQLTEQFIEEPMPPKYNKLIFSNDLSGQGNEYVLMVVNGLEHNYPNEVNNPHEVVAADILWAWYMRWQLD